MHQALLVLPPHLPPKSLSTDMDIQALPTKLYPIHTRHICQPALAGNVSNYYYYPPNKTAINCIIVAIKAEKHCDQTIGHAAHIKHEDHPMI